MENWDDILEKEAAKTRRSIRVFVAISAVMLVGLALLVVQLVAASHH